MGGVSQNCLIVDGDEEDLTKRRENEEEKKRSVQDSTEGDDVKM